MGDLHFWSAPCAAEVAGVAAYAAHARRAAETVAAAGGRLILRLLVLPGHVDCCAVPAARWASRLAARAPERVRVHVMTHYAPAGRARGDALLGRPLNPDEERRARALLSAAVPVPAEAPIDAVPPRPDGCRDPAVPVEIDPSGRIFLPFVTGELLGLAAALRPELDARRIYLSG